MEGGGFDASVLGYVLPIMLAVGAAVRWLLGRMDRQREQLAAEAERYVARVERERDEAEEDLKATEREANHYRRIAWNYFQQATAAGLKLDPPSPEYKP